MIWRHRSCGLTRVRTLTHSSRHASPSYTKHTSSSPDTAPCTEYRTVIRAPEWMSSSLHKIAIIQYGAVKTWSIHYSDVTWASWCLKSLTNQLFVQQLVQAYNKGDTKALHFWVPFWRESTIDQWIPPTKGQYCGKCFYAMASSYFSQVLTINTLYSPQWASYGFQVSFVGSVFYVNSLAPEMWQ